ncbi:MAG TPA: trypsin [Anaerolineae bacterium]|nr:trypsin [Anaerolineae bacterium]
MKRLAILFGLFIFGIIVLANMGMLNILGFINRIPYGDKAGHFILYGILTLLIDLSLLRSVQDSSPKLVVFRAALILALLIGLEEYSQQFFPKRTADWVDLLFSYIGVGFFSLVALRLKNGGAALVRPRK